MTRRDASLCGTARARARCPVAPVVSGEAVGRVGRWKNQGDEGVPSPAHAGTFQQTEARLALDYLGFHAHMPWNHPEQHETKYWLIRVPREGWAPRFGPSRARENAVVKHRRTEHME